MEQQNQIRVIAFFLIGICLQPFTPKVGKVRNLKDSSSVLEY